MIRRVLFFAFAVSIGQFTFAQYDGNTSPTYPELIGTYQKLAADHEEIELYNMGQSDYGLPIYVCILNGKQDSAQTFLYARQSTTLLINNAIHPGEPDGVNACLILINQWIKNGKKGKKMPTIAIIPAYNVGGMMNRGSSSRANQNGPEEYGFRGNAQNLDLNRDFIKMDSKNMETFATIYHALDPDVFVDTHVSNGANYQYTMSYIASVRERMAPSMADLMHDDMIPFLKERFEKNSFPIIPYVDMKGKTPEEGIRVFNDLPRYAMGYASLFNAISFTTETHMLKPFPERVEATRYFLEMTVEWMTREKRTIELARTEAIKWDQDQSYYRYNFALGDSHDSLMFHGYEFSNPRSEVTGKERLKYHEDKPWSKMIPYYKFYSASDSVSIPDYFVVEGQCTELLRKLRLNNVEMEALTEFDRKMAEAWRVLKFENGAKPYEGHFLHKGIEKDRTGVQKVFKVGDMKIPMDQKNVRFIMSVLTPDSPDSYFAWNLFDSYVQQKEYFSSYVFEDYAAKMLADDLELRTEFEQRKKDDPEFRESEWNQLYYLYKRSKFFEPTFNLLPIYFGRN